ncbi:hypothetical protein CsSME_00030069 [Camellia sinensis var. sinensis]
MKGIMNTLRLNMQVIRPSAPSQAHLACQCQVSRTDSSGMRVLHQAGSREKQLLLWDFVLWTVAAAILYDQLNYLSYPQNPLHILTNCNDSELQIEGKLIQIVLQVHLIGYI